MTNPLMKFYHYRIFPFLPNPEFPISLFFEYDN